MYYYLKGQIVEVNDEFAVVTDVMKEADFDAALKNIDGVVNRIRLW